LSPLLSIAAHSGPPARPCESGGHQCTSEQAKEKKGDMTTNVLLGTLVATGEAASGVGVTVSAKAGGAWASFDCEGLPTIETEGSRLTFLSTCARPFEEITFPSGERAVEELKGPEIGIES
jgi:hypothetical protein